MVPHNSSYTGKFYVDSKAKGRCVEVSQVTVLIKCILFSLFST